MIASRLLIARLLLPLLLVGCDGRSEMLEPQDPSLAAGVLGMFELTVLNATSLGGDVWEVATPGSWSLRAFATIPGGTPITEGTIVFQARIGGHWSQQAKVQPDQNGNATLSPGLALPATLRFKYSGQGSGVKNGLSNTVTVRLQQQ